MAFIFKCIRCDKEGDYGGFCPDCAEATRQDDTYNSWLTRLIDIKGEFDAPYEFPCKKCGVFSRKSGCCHACMLRVEPPCAPESCSPEEAQSAQARPD